MGSVLVLAPSALHLKIDGAFGVEISRTPMRRAVAAYNVLFPLSTTGTKCRLQF